MRHRRIGTSDLVVSEVGLAVGPLVGGPGARSDEEVADLLAAALDLGIAYFGATDSDDGGRAEWLLGQAVRGHRDEVTVATTFGYDTTPRPWEPAPARPGTTGRPTSPAGRWTARCSGCGWSRSTCGSCTIPAWTPSSRTSCSSSWTPRSPRARSAPTAWPSVPGRAGETRARPPSRSGGWRPSRRSTTPPSRTRAGAGRHGRRDRRRPGRPRPAGPGLEAADRARLGFLERDRDQTLDQALLRFALAGPAVATVLPEVRDRGHLAELAAAADLPPPTPEDLDLLAELREERR